MSDLFPLGDQHILICCHRDYREKSATSSLSGGVDGRRLRYASAAFTHGELHELDAGFGVHARKPYRQPTARRLLVGWMGVPDSEEMRQPTQTNGWIPDDLPARTGWVDGKLYQRPLLN